MSTKGPKPATASNKPQQAPRTIPLSQLEPTSALSVDALTEFYRLAEILDNRGTLERVDLSVLTESARIRARLDKAYADDDTKVINQLTTQRRGLLRELGLTLQPSRSIVKTVAKNEKQTDPTASKIKLHA